MFDALDIALWLAGASMEFVLLSLLILRRVYRTLPVFFFYLVYCLCGDAVGALTLRFFPGNYLQFFLVSMAIDVPFQIGIFIELGASLLRYRAAQTSRLAAVLLMALACLLVWSLAKWINPTSPAILDRLYIILAQAFAILRVSALLALVWWSSLLGLSWPDRELRITSGLGFYAIVALGVAVLNTHHLVGIEYHWLDQIQVASYFCVLTYWVPFFAKREPEPLNIYSQG
jgi:hypothetical protein